MGCFPIDPAPDAVGDPCTAEGGGTSGIDSCVLGSMCWDIDEDTDIGTCIAMCEGSPDMPTCTDTATSCVITNEDVLNLCLPNCDPLLQDCPDDGEACYVVDDVSVCAPDASGEDLGNAGDPCEFLNACDAGLTCLAPDAYGPSCAGFGGCCSPWCDLDAPGVCPELGQSCQAFFEEDPPPGFENLGVCATDP